MPDRDEVPRILVTGAAGVLGGAVMHALSIRKIAARGSSRRERPAGFAGDWARIDLLSGRGLAAAADGMNGIIHCASDPAKPAQDLKALAHLIDAAARTKLRIVYVGIAGIEQAAPAYRYYAIKLACERRLADSGIAHTIVRATQFHPFVEYLLQRLTFGPALFVPALCLQPVDVAHVANRLVEHALAGTAGRAIDLCGPERLDARTLAQSWLAARHLRKRLLPAPAFGPLRALARIAPVDGDAGGIGWTQWLSAPDAQHDAYQR
jgi:uncharacterized protein YbjT (DUF2867 family)